MSGVVIVGAGLAGIKTAEALRVGEYAGPITVLGAEDEAPYDRPPLSKQVLRGDREPVRLEAVDADVRTGVRAVGIDGAEVVLEGGERAAFEQLVIATGADITPLGAVPQVGGVHYLRTVGDCLGLRGELGEGRRVVVVGGGFIGMEVAASARSVGCEVVLVEPQRTPLGGPLGPELAGELVDKHRAEGVDVRVGVGVSGSEGGDHVEAVVLDDGSRVPADVVVIGVGVHPDTDWLEGSGVAVDDGVVVDEHLLSSVPGIWAVGDVARWYDTRTGVQTRAEHWTNATETAEVAAANILGGSVVHSPVPYFWTDQYDWKVQTLGWTADADERRLLTVRDKRVVLYGRGGRLWGVAGVGLPKVVRDQHALIAEHADLDEVAASLG